MCVPLIALRVLSPVSIYVYVCVIIHVCVFALVRDEKSQACGFGDDDRIKFEAHPKEYAATLFFLILSNSAHGKAKELFSV